MGADGTLVHRRTACEEPPGTVHASASLGAAAPAADVFGVGVLSKLGHELRSPLAGIIGLTRILLMRLAEGQADPAAQARQLEMIQASASRSLSTIEQVVDLVKLGSGQTVPVLRSVDCRSVVAEVASELRAAAAERGVRLRVLAPSHPVMITSDPEILGRLLGELAGNGVRFTDADEVRIRLQTTGNRVVIDVSDDGPGIPPDEQARIFEPFERGANAADRDDGAGLGLYLARQLAGLLGAELGLHSQTGSGSTFRATFADAHTQPGSGLNADLSS